MIMQVLCILLLGILPLITAQAIYGYGMGGERSLIDSLQWITIDANSGETTVLSNFSKQWTYGYETAYWVWNGYN